MKPMDYVATEERGRICIRHYKRKERIATFHFPPGDQEGRHLAIMRGIVFVDALCMPDSFSDSVYDRASKLGRSI